MLDFENLKIDPKKKRPTFACNESIAPQVNSLPGVKATTQLSMGGDYIFVVKVMNLQEIKDTLVSIENGDI